MTLRLVVTCEHGGNEIPSLYEPLFRRHRTLLASHRGYDPGALEIAKLLSRRLGSPLLSTRISRLLVELNRSPSHPRLFSEITGELPSREKERILSSHYYPHRNSIEERIAGYRRARQAVVHVASHSFTPTLDGAARKADVAWLYDPGRPRERALCLSWRRELRELRPDLRLRFNYPYRGTSDGLTTHLRRRFGPGYLGIELEVNQRWFFGEPSEWSRLSRAIAEALSRTLQRTGSKR